MLRGVGSPLICIFLFQLAIKITECVNFALYDLVLAWLGYWTSENNELYWYRTQWLLSSFSNPVASHPHLYRPNFFVKSKQFCLKYKCIHFYKTIVKILLSKMLPKICVAKKSQFSVILDINMAIKALPLVYFSKHKVFYTTRKTIQCSKKN